MAQEIERKFLVLNEDFKALSQRSFRIAQGYLSVDPARTVRVRLKDDQGYLTVKGSSDPAGLSRYEWEKSIPADEAKELLRLCLPGLIDKTRYLVAAGPHTYEVDVFYGENEGLTVAELELAHSDETFERPDWLGREVTGDIRYYNAHLARHPYREWKEEA